MIKSYVINTHCVDIVYNIRTVSELLAGNQEVTTTMSDNKLKISYLDLDIDKLVRQRISILRTISLAETDLSRLNDKLADKAADKQQLEEQDRSNVTNLKSA